MSYSLLEVMKMQIKNEPIVPSDFDDPWVLNVKVRNLAHLVDQYYTACRHEDEEGKDWCQQRIRELMGWTNDQS